MVRRNPQRGIFLHQLGDGDPQLFLVGLRLRFYGQLNHRLGEINRLQQHRVLLGANRVARCHRSQADTRGDVAGHHLGQFFPLVRMHAHQPPDPFPAPPADVQDGFARAQMPGVHADERELSDKRVRHDLEHERRKRLVVVRPPLDRNLFVVDRAAYHRRHVQRRWQQVHNGIQHVLDTLVLKCRTANHRENLLRDGAPPQTGHDLLGRDGLAFDVLLEKMLVAFGGRFDQLVVILPRLFNQFGWDFHFVVFCAQRLVAPHARLHADQVDDTDEVLLRSDRKLDRHWSAIQSLDDRFDGMEEVRSDAVHLVDEADSRHRILVGLPPYRFALRLNSGHGVEHRHRAIEHSQAAFHLRREIHVPRRVNNVDLMIAP